MVVCPNGVTESPDTLRVKRSEVIPERVPVAVVPRRAIGRVVGPPTRPSSASLQPSRLWSSPPADSTMAAEVSESRVANRKPSCATFRCVLGVVEAATFPGRWCVTVS